MATVAPRSGEFGRARRRQQQLVAYVFAGSLSLLVLGLFARIMTFPLRHDEQMYLPPGVLLGSADLYHDLGFNNFPGLPLLLKAVYWITGTDQYLLTGRLLVFAGWLVTAFALGWMAWQASRSAIGVCFAILALLANPVLLGPPGMIVTNNFLPIPFMLLGLALFVNALQRQEPDLWGLLGAGLNLGIACTFKANYLFLAPVVGLASLLLPRQRQFWDRLRTVATPLAGGAIIGGAPLLYYFGRDPAGFIAHAFNYHRGPHIAYWRANPDLDGTKIMSLGGKIQLAEQVWLSGASLVSLLVALALGAAVATTGGVRRMPWTVWLSLAASGSAAILSFVPTPAFPQYYAAPIPLFIVLGIWCYSASSEPARTAMHPMLFAAATVLVILATPRLLGSLPGGLTPHLWTGVRVHEAGQKLAAMLSPEGNRRPVATLAPIYPLEGGLLVYTPLASGPLVYRIADLLPAADREHYARTVSPRSLPELLSSDPPAAVVVGQEGSLDLPFQQWAEDRGYLRLAEPLVDDRYGALWIYRRP